MSRGWGAGGGITKSLIIANVGIFALEAFLGPVFTARAQELFGLSRAGLADGWYWQLLTHQFLHGNGVHLLVNMLMLWFVGRDMEDVFGKSGYLGLYFGSGIAGGLLQLPFLAPGGVLIGASGAVCGVLIALTTVFPRVPVTALLFFIIPIRLRAGTLGVVVVVASIALWASQLAPGIGHAAHIGGFAFGFVYAVAFRIYHRITRKRAPADDWEFEPDENAHPPSTTRGEVVEKLLRHGLQSLSKSEIALLENKRGEPRGRWR